MSANRVRYARDKQERISQVVKISQEIIENDGYDNLSMNLVHKRTGIPVGTLYKDFPDGKVDVVIEIAKSYGSEFTIEGNISDEDFLRNFIFRALDVGRSRRKILIAIQMETLKNPDSFLQKVKNLTSDIDTSAFQKVAEFIVGHSLPVELIMDMLGVWKAIVRQHITFRNLYGSDEKFLSILKRIIKGMGE